MSDGKFEFMMAGGINTAIKTKQIGRKRIDILRHQNKNGGNSSVAGHLTAQ